LHTRAASPYDEGRDEVIARREASTRGRRAAEKKAVERAAEEAKIRWGLYNLNAVDP
jgi:hypothetical protein